MQINVERSGIGWKAFLIQLVHNLFSFDNNRTRLTRTKESCSRSIAACEIDRLFLALATLQ